MKAPSRLFSVVTPATILINIYSTDSYENEEFWTLQTWAALTIWMRFLLYLRAVSLNYGYMVRMITGAVSGMVPFLMIFFFGICAFADAFESINSVLFLQGNITLPGADAEASFYKKYLQNYIHVWQRTYLVALGEFDPNLEFYREIDWLVFCMFTIFNITVLLNLLISIIGEIYQKYSAIRDATSF